MTDVEKGGYTIFPYIGVGVKPRKGTCVFWYNLYENGTGNTNTYHTACPVVLGNKWGKLWLRKEALKVN